MKLRDPGTIRRSLRHLGPNILARFFPRLTADAFHIAYWRSHDTWKKNTYLGQRIYQFPLDMLLYQELIYTCRPAFIVQTGVLYGGSVLYFAHLLDLIRADPSAIVIGVDQCLTPGARSLDHPRIRLVEGDSTAAETVREVQRLVPGAGGLVSLDSDHSFHHVLHELQIYSRFVSVGGYLVAEDTNINGRPVHPAHGPGPYEAVDEFLKSTDSFVRDDLLWKRNLISAHQYGWLRRVQ